MPTTLCFQMLCVDGALSTTPKPTKATLAYFVVLKGQSEWEMNKKVKIKKRQMNELENFN